MTNIKPIETYYNGYRFRSRAEARWAVLLDTLKCKYIYEPEGFKLSDGTLYLPDFYLPDSDSFLEIKGVISPQDQHKIDQFRADCEKAVTIGFSDMTFEACDNCVGWGDDFEGFIPTCDDSWLCRCRSCGKIWFMGSFGSYTCQCCGEYDGDHHFELLLDSYKNRESDNYRYISIGHEDGEIALNKARQARFEHDEKP